MGGSAAAATSSDEMAYELTAVNSVLCLLTLPLILNLALEHFLGAGQYVPPPTRKIVEVAVIILLPVAFGMLVRARAPAFAARMEKPIRLLSVLVLVLRRPLPAIAAGLVAAALVRAL